MTSAPPAATPRDGTAPRGRLLMLAVGLLVGALFLWLSFRGLAETGTQTGIAWSELTAVIRGTDLVGLFIVAVMFVVGSVMRTERWRIQVRGLTGRKPPMRESLAINAVGMAGVFLLPFRLGELVRPNLAAQRGILGASAGLAATALERVIDGIVTMGVFGVVILLMDQRGMVLSDEIALGGWLTLGIFGGALAFFIVAFRWRAGTTAVLERALGVVHGPFARRVAGVVRGFLDGLACFRTVGDAASYTAISVAYWLMNGLTNWVLIRSMSIDADPLAAFFCLCFLVVGMMIPAPPGNVGNFHAFARTALTVFGVKATPAVAFAIVLHATTVIGLLAWAGLFFLTGDLSMASVRDATRRPGTTPQP